MTGAVPGPLARSRRAVFGGAAMVLMVLAGPAQAVAQDVRAAPGALLRGLDRFAGSSRDLALQVGGSVVLGHLHISLAECRYPVRNPASDAFAWINVYDQLSSRVLFDGWMVASSPALNALDDPRYDVWVLGCITS